MLQEVTLAYVDAGFVAARAYLPEQDIGDGVLTIEVVEGELSAIDMRIDGRVSRSEAKMAFPNMLRRPLHIRDIEQGLDQIRRLPSFKAESTLDAGAATGETLLRVTAEQDRPYSVTLSADNRGATATGDRTLGINIGLDNPLGLADRWGLSVKRSGEGLVTFEDGPPVSRSVTFSGSVPYGYWTFGLEYSWSDYVTLLPGMMAPIESSGNSNTMTLSVGRVIHRDQTSKTALTLRLKRRDTVNELLGVVIDVNSRILDTAELELTHSQPAWGGNLDLSLALRHGLGARDGDGSPVEAGGDPWFKSVAGSATFTKSLKLGETTATWVAKLALQHSNDALFGSEQFSIGGFSSVRGTREAVLFGDSGGQLTNTLYLPLNIDLQPLGGAMVIAGLDVGHVSRVGTLSSATLGLRLDGKRFSTEITYSRILSHPTGVTVPSGLFTLSATAQF